MADLPRPDLAFVRAQQRAWVEGIPACWDWPVTPRPPLNPEFSPEAREMLERLDGGDSSWLRTWQNDKCAVCGDAGHVLDHDHETGLVRGLLCQSCNTKEGAAYRDYEVFERYRVRYPTLILGLTIVYVDPLGRPTTRQGQREWEQRVFGDKPREPGDNAMRGVL